ncbi:copper homeostasis membrane protein CopD [Bordetella tumulicola]|uniref:copper homeostasis membrane protein CopD n=1 Tax=Bordetella tumulicola TaxID=1649133 RepID=UPI0039F0AD1A
MTDWLNVGVRFALYVDLMLLFGLPLFALYNFRHEQRLAKEALRFDSLMVGLASLGLLLSVCSMVLLAKSMSGASHFIELKQHIFGMMITGTDAGLACAVRIGALFLSILCLALMRRWRLASLGLTVGLSAIALATLAWSGHGAMDEGTRRYVHFTADILHLLAAAGWIGALAAFALLLRPSKRDSYNQMRLLSHGLSGFAVIGTIIVIILAITGIVNYLLIVGPTLAGIVSSFYGVLLLIKLGLFAAMLGLAAANRFHLSPLLERAIAHGDHGSAVASLRKSLIFEASAAVLILAVVAWLGTLSPSGSM